MHTLWFFYDFYNTDQDIIVNIHKPLDFVFGYGEMYKKSKPRVENAQNK